jgi:DMSO/TMAO reductase YedYZ molybdopterin-dependent catalytic subunit
MDRRLSPLLIIGVLVVAGVWAWDVHAHIAPPPANLSGELRMANGTPLDSVAAYRENSIRGPPTVDLATYQLAVGGDVALPRNYTYGEVLGGFAHESRVVTLSCVEGWDGTSLFEGVPVIDLLDASNLSPDATTVIFTALDGYTTSLPLSGVRDSRLLLAYRVNNITLPRSLGYPFILVAEDRWGYKWCRWVTRIDASTDAAYRGYWERRGYSNDADVNRSFFGL